MTPHLHPLLGTELPLIQAPMAGAQGSRLAIAVSEAGALGSLPSALLSPEQLQAELARLRDLHRPWNLNFFCHREPSADAAAEQRWRALLEPYRTELGDDAGRPAAAGARPSATRSPIWSSATPRAGMPPVVSFHFGLPADDLLARVRGWGAKIIASATTVAEARWLEDHGVDAVIAQGLEAGRTPRPLPAACARRRSVRPGRPAWHRPAPLRCCRASSMRSACR